jgi:hypothetical protein
MLLMGDIRRRIDTGKLPDGQTVLKFNYTDLEDFAEWWVKINDRKIELCLEDPATKWMCSSRPTSRR